MKTPEINPVLAATLYDKGYSWNEVGRILAAARGRRTPFHGDSVYRAVRNFDRSEPKTLHPRLASLPR